MRSALVLAVLITVSLMSACDDDEFVPVCDEYDPADLTVDFSGFESHVGRDLHLRVAATRDWNPPDPGPWEEIFRAEMTIPAGVFSMYEPGGVTSCLSTHVDFFVDLNENGIYDPPPTDHAWRLYVFPWEDEQDVEVTFTIAVDPASCESYQNGTKSFCEYLDIEWPADAD